MGVKLLQCCSSQIFGRKVYMYTEIAMLINLTNVLFENTPLGSYLTSVESEI